MNKTLENIRKNNIKRAIVNFFPAAILTGIVVAMIMMYFYEYDSEYIILSIICGFFAFFADKIFIEAIILSINPLKDDVFKKYGSPQKVSKILNELEKNKIYEDKNMIISKNYISDKRNIAKLVACEDVLGAHKVVHKTNYIVDYYAVQIIDKYRHSTGYTYGVKEEETVHKILSILDKICPNAEIGYTNEELKNINNNAIKLPKEIKEDAIFKCSECGAICHEGDKYCKNCHAIFDDDNKSIKKESSKKEEKFKCDKCGAIVSESAKKCPKCGEKFDDEGDIDTSKTNMDQKYSDLKKLKKLLDDDIITKEEFEKEKKKILK